MIVDESPLPAPEAASVRARASWTRWLREAGRSLLFRRPRWSEVEVTPWALFVLLTFSTLLMLAVQYVSIGPPVRFDARAIDGGWLPSLLLLGACWVVVRRRRAASSEVRDSEVAALFGMVMAQGVYLQIVQSLLVLAIAQSSAASHTRQAWMWGAWCWLHAWGFAAALLLLGRQARQRGAWAVVLAVLVCVPALQILAPAPDFWYVEEAEVPASAPTPVPELVLTQDITEAQAGAVVESLNALQPQRRGLVDLYAITFAPYADEPVFSREAGLVARLMSERFDAKGRTVLLQNRADTAGSVPWASPLNLHRAIDRAAERMDRDDDILFIHLTSHGARNGHLAASFGPLTVDEVTPQQLKTWLDDAGVRFRVISISACYSGSWIQPLSSEGSLVMTAADADHTSYGCGRKSDLTFFGRAMYDEQLRHVYSFENAHAVARAVIERREKEAGKTDGYSNPQIFVGSAIRAQLSKLEARLAQQVPPTAATAP